MILNSASEFGRLDVNHLGMWLNLDQIPVTSIDRSALLAAAVEYDYSPIRDQAVYEAGSPEERTTLIGFLTAGVHEARHFHDLLISPYGARLMELNMRGAMAVLGAQRSLMSAAAVIVPLADWRGQLDVLRLVDVDLAEPNPKLDELAEILADIGVRQRQLDRGILTHEAPFSATSILESSALLVQLAAAGQLVGLDDASELFRVVESSPNGDRYVGVLRYLAERLGALPLGAQVVLLLAALSGDVFSEDEEALRSPVDVLTALTEWLSSRDGFPITEMRTGDDALQLVVDVFNLTAEFLTAATGCDITDSMERAWNFTATMVKYYESRIDGKGDDSPQWVTIRQVLDVYRNFQDMSARLMANFYSGPQWYLIDHYLDRLPYLPRPLTFYWSEYGLPASPELQQRFYIQHEVVVPKIPGRDTAEVEEILDGRAYDDGAAYRVAHVVAPLDLAVGTPPDGLFPYAPVPIDFEAWRIYFDSVVPLLGLLSNGPRSGIPKMVLEQAISYFDLLSVKIYSGSGRIEPAVPTEPLRQFAGLADRYQNWPQID
jgi:hypothetical protein